MWLCATVTAVTVPHRLNSVTQYPPVQSQSQSRSPTQHCDAGYYLLDWQGRALWWLVRSADWDDECFSYISYDWEIEKHSGDNKFVNWEKRSRLHNLVSDHPAQSLLIPTNKESLTIISPIFLDNFKLKLLINSPPHFCPFWLTGSQRWWEHW